MSQVGHGCVALASRATGPRTVEGKARACLNAVKHGLYASKILVSPEERRRFEAYRRQLIRDVRPTDSHELELFERILSLNWKLKRMEEAEPGMYPEPPAYPREEGDAEPTGYVDAWQRQQRAKADAEARGTYWRDVRDLVPVTTLGRFGDFERMHCHQVRLQNASGRAWRELTQWRVARRKERELAGEEAGADVAAGEASLVDRVIAQWDRENKTARQRRYRANRRARRGREPADGCRRGVDAPETPGDATVTGAGVANVATPAARPAAQPQAVEAVRRAAGHREAWAFDATRGTGTLVRGKAFLRNEPVAAEVALDEAELTPWPDPVQAPNGEWVAPALLDYLREYRPDAPELIPAGEGKPDAGLARGPVDAAGALTSPGSGAGVRCER